MGQWGNGTFDNDIAEATAQYFKDAYSPNHPMSMVISVVLEQHRITGNFTQGSSRLDNPDHAVQALRALAELIEGT